MGVLDDLRGKRVYLDANIFIYIVERHPAHSSFLEALFALIEAGEVTAQTSELTLAEVLMKPFEDGRDDLVRLYEEMVSPSAWLTLIPIDRSVLRDAARLRAQLSLKLPDAIHVASAAAGGSDVLLSNDRPLKVPSGILLRPLVQTSEP